MRLVVMVLLLVTSIGCSGSGSPPLAKVSGIVKLDGRPVPDAEIIFQPRDGGRGSAGKTDEDGQYQLSYRHGEPGAIVGLHSVSITTARRENKDEGQAEIPESIPISYNEQSTLTAEVDSGSNEFDFDLKSTARSLNPAANHPKSGRPPEAFH